MCLRDGGGVRGVGGGGADVDIGDGGLHMHAYFAIRVEKIASLLFET